MLAFQITINDEEPRMFGFEDWVVFTAHINAFRNSDGDSLELSVRGLAEEKDRTKQEHVRFGKFDLSIGDKIEFTILETNDVEHPIKRYRSDIEVQENPFTEEEIFNMEKEDYIRLKAKFESKK